MTPLVSILIPAFDAAQWIGETLRSALGQTHPNIEIIVVDDGSRDATGKQARAIAERHPGRITVVTQPNAGASAARNHALRLASGEYIQYLDADDLLSPRKIELQLALLARRPAHTLATCRWGRFEHVPTETRFADDDLRRDFAIMDWLLLYASGARMMHPSAWLVPRAVAERAGPWDETISLNDDGEYFTRVALVASGIACAPEAEAVSYYRSGLAGSLSQRRSPAALASLHHSAELIAAHLFAAEDSSRMRQALADYWKHVCYELHPDASDLSRDAERRSAALGASRVPPPLGTRARLLARLVGWRLARRLVVRR